MGRCTGRAGIGATAERVRTLDAVADPAGHGGRMAAGWEWVWGARMAYRSIRA